MKFQFHHKNLFVCNPSLQIILSTGCAMNHATLEIAMCIISCVSCMTSRTNVW